jgi:hypothetical protein
MSGEQGSNYSADNESQWTVQIHGLDFACHRWS